MRGSRARTARHRRAACRRPFRAPSSLRIVHARGRAFPPVKPISPRTPPSSPPLPPLFPPSPSRAPLADLRLPAGHRGTGSGWDVRVPVRGPVQPRRRCGPEPARSAASHRRPRALGAAARARDAGGLGRSRHGLRRAAQRTPAPHDQPHPPAGHGAVQADLIPACWGSDAPAAPRFPGTDPTHKPRVARWKAGRGKLVPSQSSSSSSRIPWGGMVAGLYRVRGSPCSCCLLDDAAPPRKPPPFPSVPPLPVPNTQLRLAPCDAALARVHSQKELAPAGQARPGRALCNLNAHGGLCLWSGRRGRAGVRGVVAPARSSRRCGKRQGGTRS